MFGGIFYNDFEDTPIGDDAQQRNDNKKKKKKSIEDGSTSSDALYGNKENDNDEDDDEYIDTDALGDWRTFRMNLADDDNDEDGKEGDGNAKKEKTKTVSAENELLLRSQSKKLADEYASGVWAHPTATVRVCVSHPVCPLPSINGILSMHVYERLSQPILSFSRNLTPTWFFSSCSFIPSKSNAFQNTHTQTHTHPYHAVGRNRRVGGANAIGNRIVSESRAQLCGKDAPKGIGFG